MNRKQMLNAYQSVDKCAPDQNNKPQSAKIYRSDRDEKLIKDYHFAKFQHNRAQIAQNPVLKSLLDKEEWTENDIQMLLKQLN